MIRRKWIGGTLLSLAVAGVAVGAPNQPGTERDKDAAGETRQQSEAENKESTPDAVDRDQSAPNAPERDESQPKANDRPDARDSEEATQDRTDREGRNDTQSGESTSSRPAQNKAFLGVRVGPSPTSGVRVEQVQPGGPASRAGLRPGDYILTLDGTKISSAAELDSQINRIGVGKSGRLGIWRNGQNVFLSVNFMDTRRAAFREGADPQENQAWLGLSFKRGEDGKEGVEVTGVYPSGPAARAGFYSGDQVKMIEGKKVEEFNQILNVLKTKKPGQQVKFTVGREEEDVQLTATLGSRSDYFYQPVGQGEGIENQGTENGNDQGRQPSLAGLDSEDEFPEHAMMLEYNRRLAEQNQRLEERLDSVIKELRDLRAEMRNGRPGAQPGAAPRRPGANAESNSGASVTPTTPAIGVAPRGTATRGQGASKNPRPGARTSGGTTTRGNP